MLITSDNKPVNKAEHYYYLYRNKESMKMNGKHRGQDDFFFFF